MSDDDSAVSFGRAIAGSGIDDERGWRALWSCPLVGDRIGVERYGSTDWRVGFGRLGSLIVYRAGRPRARLRVGPFTIQRIRREPFVDTFRMADGGRAVRVGSRVVYREQ